MANAVKPSTLAAQFPALVAMHKQPSKLSAQAQSVALIALLFAAESRKIESHSSLGEKFLQCAGEALQWPQAALVQLHHQYGAAPTRTRNRRLNDDVFQTQLFALEKPLRHAAMETLAKIKQMSWQQIYQDAGLKREKINSLPQNDAIGERYSLRLNQSRRMVARRVGNAMQLLSIPDDHVASYGKK